MAISTRWVLFLFFAANLYASPLVELFIYWRPNFKGEEAFPLEENTPYDQLSMQSRIRRRLNERGISIRSWELDQNRKAVLSWENVQSWSDFWDWMFPKKVDLKEKQWVFWSLGPYLKKGDFSRIPSDHLSLFLWEPPTVEKQGYDPAFLSRFGKVYTWDDDLVDNKKFFKFYYPVLGQRIGEIVPFDKKKLCVLVSSRLSSKHPRELYSEREKTIRFFEDKPDLFDLYGRNWAKRKYRNYKGEIPDKIAVIKNYKFSICYENMRDVKGYVTEKIFDCFIAGNVPVYWGASNIDEFVPADCYIDRRKFLTHDELLAFLQSMSAEEYQGYLDRAEAFLKSEKAQAFSLDRFVDTFVESCSSAF